MIRIPRGWTYRAKTGLLLQVLGGPTIICGNAWYTVVAMEDGERELQNHYYTVTVKPGTTFLHPAESLARGEFMGEKGIYGQYDKVVYQDCPNCDIDDDMIFYEGDYICAWCREHLET